MVLYLIGIFLVENFPYSAIRSDCDVVAHWFMSYSTDSISLSPKRLSQQTKR